MLSATIHVIYVYIYIHACVYIFLCIRLLKPPNQLSNSPQQEVVRFIRYSRNRNHLQGGILVFS